MKSQQLTRSEARDMNSDSGEVAEGIAADLYGYSQFVDADQFDAARDSGAVIEVKSTQTRLQNGARGRFRLWKDQHEALLEYDRGGSAFYVFVLFDVSERPPIARLVRRNPADVGRQIGARGGWNDSGHPKGQQIKLPYSAVFDDD